MKVEQLIEDARKTILRAKENLSWTGDERDQARQFLELALGRAPKANEEVPAPAQRRFHRLVERRASGEPVPYILGWTEFRDLRLKIGPGAFVPRATSEFLAEQAIRRLRRRGRPVAVDLATGIGPIPLSIAYSLPKAEVHGTDISAAPLRQARANARALGLNVRFHLGSLFDPLPASLRGRVDTVTIHPPYVAAHEVDELPSELKNYEPAESLTDKSKDGTYLAGIVAEQGHDWLRPGGWLLIEVGSYLARALKSLMNKAGYVDVKSTEGPLGYTRVIVGRSTQA
ncbi:MAG: peptide chain release factor N(5)-glutamine methyltransferase [Actinobacteria bacterium]|nr:MAG: peptide chain release factor N(5)-glutamine methyltransferase [Actinomycetota bacterium]